MDDTGFTFARSFIVFQAIKPRIVRAQNRSNVFAFEKERRVNFLCVSYFEVARHKWNNESGFGCYTFPLRHLCAFAAHFRTCQAALTCQSARRYARQSPRTNEPPSTPVP